jgi:hypothetical protein
LLSQGFEILNRVFVKPDRQPLFRFGAVRILDGFRKVVLASHGIHLGYGVLSS